MEFPMITYPNGWLDNMRQTGRLAGSADAYRMVPMVYRAVNLRADAISSVPFTLQRNGETVDWPWTANFSQLIKETERSLLVYGAAYWLKVVKGRTLTGFVALNPSTMTYMFNPSLGDIYQPYKGMQWWQTANGKMYGPWTIDDIVYFREPSFVDDVGPGVAPVSVALVDAQLTHYLNAFAMAFFQGGAQPVTVMNTSEYTDRATAEQFEASVNAKAAGGIVNAFKFLFLRGGDVKITQLTPPLDTLQMPELSERSITAIAATLGVPRTMLEASAANYATADSDRQSFWRETIVPRLALYASVINTQVMSPIKYELIFKPETMDVFQVDEAARASSFLSYVQGGIPARSAAQLLGIDNLDEYWPAEPEQTTTPETVIIPDAPPTEDAGITPIVMVPDATASKTAGEWALLSKKIERRIKTGRDPRTTFDSSLITPDQVASVMARCVKGMTVSALEDVINEVKATVDDLTPEERRLYDRIVADMQRKGQSWATSVAKGEVVDPTLAEIIKPALQVELGRTMTTGIDSLGVKFGPQVDPAKTGEYVQDWLSEYVPDRSKEIDDNSRKILQRVVEQYRTTPSMTKDDIAYALRGSYDQSRAMSIAITETTRAASQAVNSYRSHLGSLGFKTNRTWVTDNDDRVCAICGPLHLEPEEEWLIDYPDGPPAHPRCRCTTSIGIIRE